MSKLYKDLKYDTDWVMQPGDPLTSLDGNTSVQAVNGGKATITMPGLAEPGASLSNDVTLEDLIQLLDLPETSTLDDVRSVLGLPATATLYDASVTPITKALVTSPVKWEEISNKPDIWPVSMGGTGVDGSSQAANKVLASPASGTGAISFRSLVAADIPDLSTSKLTTGTLGVARGGTGKISHTVNSVIIGGISTTGALQNVASASGAFYSTGSNKKPTFGTLPVAQGGTGVNGSSQAINKVLASPASGSAGAISFRSLVEADIPTLSTGKISGLGNAATKNVGTTSGTVAAGDHTHSGYAASSHNHAAGDINSGTLAVARGGTGADGSSITKNYVLAAPSAANGAVSFRALVAADLPSHTHSDYVSKSATGLQSLSGSLSFPYAKELIFGEPGDGYGISMSAYSNRAMILVSKDYDEYCWLKPNEIGYTMDGESTETILTFPPPAKSGTIATSVDLNLQPIESITSTSSSPSLTMDVTKHTYRFNDSINCGIFPTLVPPTGLSSCYYEFEIEWTTSATSAVYPQTTSTIPAVEWLTAPTIATDGSSHTYCIAGKYDAIGNKFLLNCWRIISTGGSGNLIAYATTAELATKQDKITASGLLKGNGSGGITAATSGTDYAAASHTHSDYVSKSETSSQSLSGSLSFPATKQAYFGNQNSSYAWVWDGGFGVGVGSTDHTGIQHDKITHTVSSDTVSLTFPSSAKSGDIATEYDIRKRTRALYEQYIGDASNPASAIEISEDYNIYHFWIGTNGTFPTFTFSFPDFTSVSARFPFTLIAHVDSGASTLTGPSGWVWTSGAGLPTSGFAGKVLWISGIKAMADTNSTVLVSCWRCA